MTNKKKIFAVSTIALFLGAGAYFSLNKKNHSEKRTLSAAQLPTKPKIDSASAPEVAPSQVTRTPASVTYVNSPSLEWKEHLITSLKNQAGDNLKDIQVKKEKSLIWTRDSNPLSAESVLVTLKGNQGEETTFRAIVDSQTGKILESWDRPVSDPADVKAGFHLKLDERYSN